MYDYVDYTEICFGPGTRFEKVNARHKSMTFDAKKALSRVFEETVSFIIRVCFLAAIRSSSLFLLLTLFVFRIHGRNFVRAIWRCFIAFSFFIFWQFMNSASHHSLTTRGAFPHHDLAKQFIAQGCFCSHTVVVWTWTHIMSNYS